MVNFARAQIHGLTADPAEVKRDGDVHLRLLCEELIQLHKRPTPEGHGGGMCIRRDHYNIRVAGRKSGVAPGNAGSLKSTHGAAS